MILFLKMFRRQFDWLSCGEQSTSKEYDHEDLQDVVNLTVNIPDEPNQNIDLKIVSKSWVSRKCCYEICFWIWQHFSWFEKSFSASAERGSGISKSYNSNVESFGTTVTESALSSNQLDGNNKINSITKLDDGNSSHYADSSGPKTFYRTNTVANGTNENDTNILDFEYIFPIDNSYHSNTGSSQTEGLYAPLSVANADWDNTMHENEKARYGCYDSGQGCGSGSNEMVLSGSMVQDTELVDATFTGTKWFSLSFQ